MVIDFKDLCDKASAGIQVLIKNVDCFAWTDYSDKGNPCYDPYTFDTKLEREEDALMHAAVKVALKKNSSTHVLLGDLVAKQTGNKYVTYDWLIKAVGRILNGTDLDDLEKMCDASRAIRGGARRY